MCNEFIILARGGAKLPEALRLLFQTVPGRSQDTIIHNVSKNISVLVSVYPYRKRHTDLTIYAGVVLSEFPLK